MRLLQLDDLTTSYTNARPSWHLRAFTEVFAIAIEMPGRITVSGSWLSRRTWTYYRHRSDVTAFALECRLIGSN